MKYFGHEKVKLWYMHMYVTNHNYNFLCLLNEK